MKAFLPLAAMAAFLTGAAALPAFTQAQTPPPADTQGAGASSTSSSMMACGSMSPNMAPNMAQGMGQGMGQGMDHNMSQNMGVSSMSHMSDMPAAHGAMDQCPSGSMSGMNMMSASPDSAASESSSSQ